jgi:phenylpropionate dioxygenase-like ring-hydroxylating dioxygenase large terminal subunit
MEPFTSAWQYAGPAELVAEPGTFLASEAGPIPVVVTRARDGELRALLNVCRHRGHVVASGCGSRATLQCPYHAWTYELDGSLRRAPRSEREPGFDTTGISLLPLAVATWGPFVFVNPDRDAARFEAPGYIEVNGLVFKSRERREHAEDWQTALERSGSRVLLPNTTIEISAKGLWISRWLPLPTGGSVETSDAYTR